MNATTELPNGERLNHSDSVTADSPQAFRIAIIGGGPRGMYCLDALTEQVAACPVDAAGRLFEVVMYEPAKTLGAGVVYSIDQPHHLRMNFSNQRISAWQNGLMVSQRKGVERLTLLQWLQRHHPLLADPAGHAPRSIVGDYLSWCFENIVRHLPDGVQLETVQTKANDVRRTTSGWQVVAGNESRDFDHVLITTGHGGWQPTVSSGNSDPDSQTVRSVGCIFPVHQRLNQNIVPASSAIAARGFALTFIDAALTLTEGRGGAFSQTDQGWAYKTSGNEPAKIYPWSRSGRPMFAKPDESQSLPTDELQAVWKNGNNRIVAISAAHGEVDFAEMIWPIVLSSADQALAMVTDKRPSVTGSAVKRHGRTLDWFEGWLASDLTAEAVYETMLNSFKVATGQSPLDEAWALGESWRQLYSAIVQRISHGGLALNAWPPFLKVAREMERIAFGPPAENLGRILALVDAGIVDLSLLRGRLDRDKDAVVLANHSVRRKVDVSVDAVILAPGYHRPDSVIGQLLQRQQLRRMTPTSGICVDDCGGALDENDQIIAGLSVLGRSTEGCILGNDTLSRKLHGQPDRWAERLVNERVRN